MRSYALQCIRPVNINDIAPLKGSTSDGLYVRWYVNSIVRKCSLVANKCAAKIHHLIRGFHNIPSGIIERVLLYNYSRRREINYSKINILVEGPISNLFYCIWDCYT